MMYSHVAILALGALLTCYRADAKILQHDFVERMLTEEQSACHGGHTPDECVVHPKPQCTPFRSVDYCPPDESFQTYIQSRTSFLSQNKAELETNGVWFHRLEDKLAGYKLAASLGLTPPRILYCTDDSTTLSDFDAAPGGTTGFVVRATNLHSNFGIYVLPDGFGGKELLRNVNMTAADIESDLSALKSSKIVIEEYVGSEGSLPTEYKFHMFNGEVGSINVVANRGTDCACWAEMDSNQDRLDQYGCFVSSGTEKRTGECTTIDFQAGSTQAYPMKGMDMCSDLEVIDDCLLQDMIDVAKKASEGIGAYVRIDFFVGADGKVYFQEFATNHMNGLRHCSAKKGSNGCIDPCFQGTMWKDVGGNSTFGGPQAEMPSGFKDFLSLNSDAQRCNDVVSNTPIIPAFSSRCSGNGGPGISGSNKTSPTSAPATPIDVPSGPYITAAKANEKVKIPDPPVPSLTDRTSCPHLDADLLDWHSQSTWNGAIPSSGDVVLPPNSRIIVRQSITSEFGLITIPQSSELIFGENTTGIELDVHGMDVQGKLTIGSEQCRINTPVTITLHGERPDDIVTNPRPTTYKGISVTGQINMHGRRFYRTWTRLALTVEPGDKVLLLQHEVNWAPGQEVVLVTTAMKDSREWHRNDIAVVKSVETNPEVGIGAAVLLEQPVAYQHVANNGYQGEVGLLTRTIKVQGDEASEPSDPDPMTCRRGNWVYGDFSQPCGNTMLTGFGGHIIVHGNGKGYVEGVELYRMGQTNVMGKYPMHFHLLDDKCTDCFFRDSSVHRSFYRCISIHGTHYTHVSENVAYDVTGFCYYLEDGVEHHNRIEFNLGAHIHLLGPEPPSGGGQTITPIRQNVNLTLPADVTASAFYITNIENYIIGNSASGGWAGFAFPNLPTPLGPHRNDTTFRPSSVLPLTFDGNTAHSTAWWWYHAAAFYWGGSLYYDGEELVYNAGRDTGNNRNTCLVNKCVTGNKNCGQYCQPHEKAWISATNNKAFLAAGVGFGSWSGRFDILGFECHDCGLAVESLSNGGFWINDMLSVCRTQQPIGMPEAAKAKYIAADGFKWYDTNQEHIITNSTFRNCGFRSDEFNQYNQDANRGCADETDIGCSHKSSVFGMLTHSDQFVPEMMQATRSITFENCGRRFRQIDFRRNQTFSSVSGREQNWYDIDGSITGLGEKSVAASGLLDAGMWWQVDKEAVYDPQGPLWFFKLLPSESERGLGHVRMRWDDSLTSSIGKTNCGNGNNIPCEYLGYVKHIGKRFQNDTGLPVTANADIVGPVGGFGWKLELKAGAPKSVRFDQIEIDPATPLLLSIPYPPGTSFNVSAQAGWCKDSAQYTCSEHFHQVNTIEDVRNSLGNAYHVDANGVLTFRIVQTPKLFVGKPDYFMPSWDDAGKWGKGYALERFERDGVRLPGFSDGSHLKLDADCESIDGVYCSGATLEYDPEVCPIGYSQSGYDKCTSTSDASNVVFAKDGVITP